MTDRTRAIHFTAPRKWIEINKDDATEMRISEGEWVEVTSPRGSVFAEARIVDTVQPGVAWMPFHYAGGANMLSDAHSLDPISSIPGYKQIGVKISKVSSKKAKALANKADKEEIMYYANENPNAIRYKEEGVEKLLMEEEEKLLSGAPNLIEMQDKEGEEFTKSQDYMVKEQSLISWCRNDSRKKARKGKAGWLPK